MLDGKRYYAVFPDEDPEMRPRITAVLDALGKLQKHSANTLNNSRSRQPHGNGTNSQQPVWFGTRRVDIQRHFIRF
jgi:hypothetical protein